MTDNSTSLFLYPTKVSMQSMLHGSARRLVSNCAAASHPTKRLPKTKHRHLIHKRINGGVRPISSVRLDILNQGWLGVSIGLDSFVLCRFSYGATELTSWALVGGMQFLFCESVILLHFAPMIEASDIKGDMEKASALKLMISKLTS